LYPPISLPFKTAPLEGLSWIITFFSSQNPYTKTQRRKWATNKTKIQTLISNPNPRSLLFIKLNSREREREESNSFSFPPQTDSILIINTSSREMKSLVSNSILQIPNSSLAIQFPHKLVFKTKLSFRDRHSLLFRNHKSLKFTAFVASSSNSVTSSSNSAQVAEEDPESTQLFEVFTYLFLTSFYALVFLFFILFITKLGSVWLQGKFMGKKMK
jgi:hypothetical protein